MRVAEPRVIEALQMAWNDFVDDTGCYPDCFEYKNGKLYADFAKGNFALYVTMWLDYEQT